MNKLINKKSIIIILLLLSIIYFIHEAKNRNDSEYVLFKPILFDLRFGSPGFTACKELLTDEFKKELLTNYLNDNQFIYNNKGDILVKRSFVENKDLIRNITSRILEKNRNWTSNDIQDYVEECAKLNKK